MATVALLYEGCPEKSPPINASVFHVTALYTCLVKTGGDRCQTPGSGLARADAKLPYLFLDPRCPHPSTQETGDSATRGRVTVKESNSRK